MDRFHFQERSRFFLKESSRRLSYPSEFAGRHGIENKRSLQQYNPGGGWPHKVSSSGGEQAASQYRDDMQ